MKNTKASRPLLPEYLDEPNEQEYQPFASDMVVAYDTAGKAVSHFGDDEWNLSSMSVDGTTKKLLRFYKAGEPEPSALAIRIRRQQKSLIWLHMDAGRLRAWVTLRNTNLALRQWAAWAEEKGQDLFTLLSSPESVAERSSELNTNYAFLTASVVRTMWRHQEKLGVSVGVQLQAIRSAISVETASRPETQQTPLIPSRIYCEILARLGKEVDRIEGDLNNLLGEFSRRGDGAGILRCQVILMLVLAAYTGMRVGEVAILPLEECLVEFEFLGSPHFELRGSTHKLNKGVKRATSWVTSREGARAARLAHRIGSSIAARNDVCARKGQTALLFASMANPFKMMSLASIARVVASLRMHICPVIQLEDIDELDRLDLAGGCVRDDIEVGKHWPLAFHQLRRSLAVYAHRSGMVGLPALKAQLQHITQEMSAYYANGFCDAVNLVFDPTHFSHEWQAAKSESSYFAYTLNILFGEGELLGQGVSRMAKTVQTRSRQETLKLFNNNKIAYRETPLGACVSTEGCKTNPLEPIPYECLQTNCVNMVVFGKRLDMVVKQQIDAVASLNESEPGSVEHRIEVRNLETLLKARTELAKGAN